MIRHPVHLRGPRERVTKHQPREKSADTPQLRSESSLKYAKIHSMARTSKGSGAVRGRAQPGRRVSYNPESGENWRTGVVVLPEMAKKAITAADSTGMSFAGLVNELLRRMPVDDHGRPLWAGEINEQPALPLTG